MITKWGLKNFKSIREADLDLAPLTVFTGVNSSGKSSFLQSIVMLVQSVRNEDGLVISLDGPLINLRDFEQIYCKNAEKEFASIYFIKSKIMMKENKNVIGVKFNILPEEDKPEKQIHYEFEFGPSLQPPIVESFTGRCMVYTFSMESREDKTDKNVIYLKLPLAIYADPSSFKFMEAIDAVSLNEFYIPDYFIKPEFDKFTVYLVRYSNSFLPDCLSLMLLFDDKFTKRVADLFVKILTDLPDEKLSGKEQANDYVKKCIRRNTGRGHEQYENNFILNKFYSVFFGFLIKYFDNSPGRDIIKKFWNQEIFIDSNTKTSEKETLEYRLAGWYEDLSAFDDHEKEKIIDFLNKDRFKEDFIKESPHTFEELALPRRLKETRDWLFDFFYSKIKYLGPLREDPQWEYTRISSGIAIDPKGKYTAAVIHRLNEERIEIENYFSPNDLESHERKTLPKKMFSDALYEWLHYINLSDNFRTKNLGAEKLEIILTVDKNEFAIPQLGTGVSQVLPILVICLSAAPGSTIIIEQPELHLHPKMQSRLADFFIAMALSGRQCLIETHSEYMIEQLRYRIVRSPLDKPLHKKIKIYFATKRDGITSFDDMDINEFAAPHDWPEDFFDESHKISNKIMDETIKKMDESEKDE